MKQQDFHKWGLCLEGGGEVGDVPVPRGPCRSRCETLSGQLLTYLLIHPFTFFLIYFVLNYFSIYFLLVFTYVFIHLFIFFFFKILFTFLERGEREKHRLVASHTPPTRDLAYTPGMCPDWESNQQPFGSQASSQSTEPHQPGPFTYFLIY